MAILITLLKFCVAEKYTRLDIIATQSFALRRWLKILWTEKSYLTFLIILDILNYNCTFYKFHIFFNFNGINNVKNFLYFKTKFHASVINKCLSCGDLYHPSKILSSRKIHTICNYCDPIIFFWGGDWKFYGTMESLLNCTCASSKFHKGFNFNGVNKV